MAQTTLDQRMLGVGTALTDHTITSSDVITFADVGDSNLTKKDTVQGVLDLVAAGGGSWDHIVTSTPSGSANLTYTVGAGSTMNTSNYDLFKIEIVMSINSSSSEIIQIQPNGAGAIRVVGNYTRGSNDLGDMSSYSTLTTTGAASSGVYREVTATNPAVAICPAGSNRISGQVFYNPLGNPAFLTGRTIMRDSNGSNWRMGIFDWAASMNSAPTALVFFYGSNFGSGTEFSVYGLRQS